MAHAYLYEVGPGKTYATFAAAFTQLDTDWGTDEFDAPVEVRVYDDTYTEMIDIPGNTNPTTVNMLRIWAADGNNSVIVDATGESYALNNWTSPYNCEYVWYKGLELKNASTSGIRCVAYEATWENLNVHDNGQLITTRSGGMSLSILDSILDGDDQDDLLKGANDYRLCAVRTLFKGYDQTLFVHAETFSAYFESCAFDGSDMDAADSNAAHFHISGNLRIPLVVVNCTFYKGNRVLILDRNPAPVKFINCLFYDPEDEYIGDLSGNGTPQLLHIEGCSFYGGTSTPILIDENGTYDTVAELRAAGYDVTNTCIETDPTITTPFDGTIQAGSPCIEAGIGSGVIYGIGGNSFAQVNTHPSIGCDAQHDTDGTAPTFDDTSVTVTDNQNGTLQVSFAAGTGVDHYEISVHTSSMGDAATIAAHRVACVDEDSSSSYSIPVCALEDGTVLSAGTTYYVNVQAVSSTATADGNTTNVSKMVTDPHGGVGYSWTNESVAVVPLQTTETTIYECPTGSTATVFLILTNVDSSSRTFQLHFRVGGVAAADANLILPKDKTLEVADSAGDTEVCGPVTMEAGDIVSALASANDVINVHVSILLQGTT